MSITPPTPGTTRPAMSSASPFRVALRGGPESVAGCIAHTVEQLLSYATGSVYPEQDALLTDRQMETTTHIAVLAQSTITDATGRLFDVMLLGVG